jgi:large subunit ribosomal protein L29
MKVKEIRDQSEQELGALAMDLEKEIFQLKNELSVARKLEKPHLLKTKRKDRARVLTILSQKQQSGR